MDKLLNYQVSLFGQYSNIRPEQTLTTELLTLLKTFLPGIANISSVNILTNQIQTEERMQFVSIDRSYSISFFPDRIDICYIYNDELKNEKTLIEVKQTIHNLLIILNKKFRDLSSNRLATSCNLLTRQFNSDEYNAFINNQSNKELFFKDSNLFEWCLRYNSKFDENISGKQEQTNHIVEMQKAFINGNETKQFLVIIDINTDPLVISERFTINNLIEFQDFANNIIERYINAIEGR